MPATSPLVRRAAQRELRAKEKQIARDARIAARKARRETEVAQQAVPPKRVVHWIIHSRRALMGKEDEAPSTDQLRVLWLSQNQRCALTGMSLAEDVRPNLDHKISRLRGGSNGIENLQWVHPKANFAKHSGTEEEFRTWLLAAAEALKQKMQIEELL